MLTTTAAPVAKRKVVHRAWWHLPCELIVLLGAAILCLEVIFQCAGVGEQICLETDPLLGYRAIPGKLVTHRNEGYSRGCLSSAGLRDSEHQLAKPSGTYRIAALGDSATAAFEVPLSSGWAKQLESRLNVDSPEKRRFEVINFGCPTYSTVQELIQYNQIVSKYSPDLVVLLFTSNDCMENLLDPSKHDEASVRPFAYMSSDQTLQFDCSRIAPQPPLIKFLASNSRVYAAIMQTHRSLMVKERMYAAVNHNIEKLVTKLQPPINGPLYKQQNPVAITNALISELNRQVRSNGARLVVMFFPDHYNDKFYVSEMRVLKQLGQRENFDCIDLDQLWRAGPENPAKLYVVSHLSERGHKKVSDALGSYVEKSVRLANKLADSAD